MSRKETSNTWQDGLVMDLNPMNTPNTVLTDNLNGTIITYNGNEHLLQNDQGNFKLKHCKLSPNFVPVGLKEYADILYIVSYNPITEETEIGSYPSPMIVDSEQSNNKTHSFGYTLAKYNNQTETFNNIDSSLEGYVFAEKDMKINPGDLYKLQTTKSEDPTPLYEGIVYEIIDSDKKSHDITEHIKKHLLTYNDDFEYVPWDVPGWLSFKPKIANFDSFGMVVTHFNKQNDKLTIQYRFQFQIDDPILINLFNDVGAEEFFKGFKIDLKQLIGEQNKDIVLDYNTSQCTFSYKEWYDNNIIVQISFAQNSFELTEEDNKSKRVIVSATPILFQNDDDYNYSIVYDHLTTNIDTFFENFITIGDNIFVGNNVYQFSRNIEDDGEYLKFITDFAYDDKNGAIGVIPENIYLHYKFYDINGYTVQDWKSISILDAYFDKVSEPSDASNTFNLEWENLDPEEIYKILLFINTEDTVTSSFSTISFDKEALIHPYKEAYFITSTVFKNYIEDGSYSNFESIPMEEWTSKYLENVVAEGNLKVENIEITPTNEKGINWEKDEYYWNTTKGFKEGFDEKLDESITQYQKYKIKFNVTNPLDDVLDKYRIGMWKTLIPESTTYYLSGLRDKDGTIQENVKVIPATIDSYSEDIGEWDTGTANIYNEQISYDSYVIERDSIVFTKENTFEDIPSDLTVSDLTVSNLSLNFKYYTIINQFNEEGWAWKLNTLTSYVGQINIGTHYSETDKEKDNVVWDENNANFVRGINHNIGVIGVQVGVSNEDSWNGKDIGTAGPGGSGDIQGDYTGFSSIFDEERKWYWDHEYHGKGELSPTKYFIVLPVSTNNKRVLFLNVDSDNPELYSNIKNLNAKVISGNSLGKSHTSYIPTLDNNSTLENNLGVDIQSEITLNDKWNYNNRNLFLLEGEPDLLTWKNIELKVNLTNEVGAIGELESQTDEIKSEIDSVIENIELIDGYYNDYFKTGYGYFGIRESDTPSNIISTLLENTKLVDNKLVWQNTNDSNLLQISSTDDGRRVYFNIGHYYAI